MNSPTGEFTINQAAELWIEMIQSPETKAAPEQKSIFIAKIRSASKDVIGTKYGVGNLTLTITDRLCFADATNAMKRIISK